MNKKERRREIENATQETRQLPTFINGPNNKIPHRANRNEKALQIKMDSHLIEIQCEK